MAAAVGAAAQAPNAQPRVNSPEVQADRKVTFRLLAPKAESVRLGGSDIPGLGQGRDMTKDDKGVWEITLGPIEPGAYRHGFNLGGVAVIDPRNPAVSESNGNVWSYSKNITSIRCTRKRRAAIRGSTGAIIWWNSRRGYSTPQPGNTEKAWQLNRFPTRGRMQRCLSSRRGMRGMSPSC